MEYGIGSKEDLLQRDTQQSAQVMLSRSPFIECLSCAKSFLFLLNPCKTGIITSTLWGMKRDSERACVSA